MPSVALEGWMIHAQALTALLERGDRVTVIDLDAALSDPLVVLDALGLGAELAVHATQAPPPPSGLPILIAAETVSGDAEATRLDAKFGRMAAGLDAALDVDELAQSYSDAVLHGNVTAIEQLRDELMNRQMLRRAEVSHLPQREDAAAAAPPTAAPEPDLSGLAQEDDVRKLEAEVRMLTRTLSGRDRSMARMQARVVRLEGLLNALISDAPQPVVDRPDMHGSDLMPEAELPPTPPQMPMQAPEFAAQAEPPAFAPATETAISAQALHQTLVPPMTTAGMNSSGATLGLSQREMPDPEPMAQPGDQHGMGYGGNTPASQPVSPMMPGGPSVAPMGGGYSEHTQPGQQGFGAPQAAQMAYNPGLGQMPVPGAGPEFAGASAVGGPVPPMGGQMPPIHAHATPENPLALPPQHTTTDMGPDRPPYGGGQPSAPAKKGGLLGRLRRR